MTIGSSTVINRLAGKETKTLLSRTSAAPKSGVDWHIACLTFLGLGWKILTMRKVNPSEVGDIVENISLFGHRLNTTFLPPRVLT